MEEDLTARDSSAVHQSSADVDASQLFELLLHGDTVESRHRAAELLGHLNVAQTGTDRATVADTLIESIVTDDDIGVRTRAIESLYGYGETHVERLVEELAETIQGGEDAVTAFFRDWLDSDWPELRLVAVSSFRRFGDERVVSWLRDAFGDSDARVRSRAVESYGHRESVPAEPIRPLLGDEYAHVRRKAARALAAIGDREALELLLPVARSDDESMRRIAVEQLHRLDEERTASVLLDALSDSSGSVRRASLVSLLQLVSGGNAVSLSDVRRSVLARSNTPSSNEVASLLERLLEESADRRVRATAMRLLGELAVETDDGGIQRTLIEWLDDGADDVAETAVEHLQRIDGERIEKPLKVFIQDGQTSPAGRRRAESILERIRDEAAAALEGKSIQYTYVSDPSDYTLKHGRNTE
jgi:HEAT repeat protein